MIEPGTGRLAGGDSGTGRLAEPADIVAAAIALLAAGPLDGRRILVTAGGTREPIDPVRFIGNRSSGKQGHAVAEEAAARGAAVTLVTTTSRPAPPGAEVVVGRDRGGDARCRDGSQPAAATSWSWPRRWPTSARRRPPTAS